MSILARLKSLFAGGSSTGAGGVQHTPEPDAARADDTHDALPTSEPQPAEPQAGESQAGGTEAGGSHGGGDSGSSPAAG